MEIPIGLQVKVKTSKLVEGGLVNGKFDSSKVSSTLFESTQIAVAPGKAVRLAELLVTASDERSKKTRGFLDTLWKAARYTNDDIDLQCADLVSALDSYLSKADARAVFWAFLQTYGSKFDRQKALGSGRLRTELTDLGLPLT